MRKPAIEKNRNDVSKILLKFQFYKFAQSQPVLSNRISMVYKLRNLDFSSRGGFRSLKDGTEGNNSGQKTV